MLLKRVFDLLGAGILLLLLSPLFVVSGLLVVFEDGCPVFYRRRVVGTSGEFDAYKFRSMCKNADAILAADPALRQEFERNFKLEHDPRVIARRGAAEAESGRDAAVVQRFQGPDEFGGSRG